MITKNLISKNLILMFSEEPNLRISNVRDGANSSDMLTFARALNSLQREFSHTIFAEMRSTLTSAE